MNTAVNLADAASASKNPSPALPKRNPIPNSVSIGATSEVTGGGGPASEKSTSRFKVEEVPNYEPILFTTSESGMTFSITFTSLITNWTEVHATTFRRDVT